MSDSIPKQYDPQAAQNRWYSFWDERGYFDADPNPDNDAHFIYEVQNVFDAEGG